MAANHCCDDLRMDGFPVFQGNARGFAFDHSVFEFVSDFGFKLPLCRNNQT
jgi:hypothetical protein